MGSDGRKGMRKIKVSGKRPGPVPEEPPPKINKKAQKAAGMEKARLSSDQPHDFTSHRVSIVAS